MRAALAGAIAASLVLVVGPRDARAEVRPLTTTAADATPKEPRGASSWMAALLSGSLATDRRTDPDPRAAAEGMKSAPPIVDLVPRASLVVRDWRGSLRIAGPGTLLDDVRPSASNRSIMLRVASGGRFAPFVQAAVGQFRLDPRLFPAVDTKDRVAASIGAGVQIRAFGVTFAAEVQDTALYDDGDSGLVDPEGTLLSAMFAARATF